MTNFYVTYTLPDQAARDGYMKEVLEQEIIEKSCAEEGCIRYAYFYPVGSDNTLFLWEQWESRDHQKAHCQTEHFAALGQIKARYGAQTRIEIEDQVVEG